ncbi:hypothetical protein Leryth_002445 [Lithospermum erythrorhizon]|nr:hypothetical protein Leryth_002445 [Lithospermum erythrorhizon]
MLRGSSGFYTYAIFEQLPGWPALHMEEARITFKLEPKLFTYMAISDDKQRTMPNHHDFQSGKRLAYGEAKLLTNPEDKSLKGQVDDKYQYSMDNKDSFVHGWVSSGPRTGFWVITPSNEFRSGGPMKADLTSHSGPTALSIFFSGHYAGPDMGIDTKNGEPWKKVYGPVFIYLNSNSDKDPRTLWNDAKRQMVEETKKWPYDFPLSRDLLRANQRGTVTGRLMVNDRYINKGNLPAKSAYIGLAPPGEVGSWQTDSKGYQFWTTTNEDGSFSISNIRPGIYNVYAWVPGVIGDYKYEKNIEIKSGSNMGLGDLAYIPPRSGPTIWEIGISDRTAGEFFIPDPAPGFIYTNLNDKYRQYGLWDRYTDLYPKDDLVYTVGKSDYRKDWFFAHVNRKVGNKTYVPTTWQIKFPLANIRGTYTLRIALASATYAELRVWINDPHAMYPIFKTDRFIGRDNAIARHGIHGLYWLYQVDLPASSLVNGINTLYFKQTVGGSFNGVMYDYIRLEGPPS